MKPTDEQIEVVRLFRTGESMVVDALAGTGKTTTLQLVAASTTLRGQCGPTSVVMCPPESLNHGPGVCFVSMFDSPG